MKNCGCKSGFTLIEMMMVIAVILILLSMVLGVSKYLDDQAKVRLTKNTIALIGNALEQFHDFGYEYKHADYTGLAFPLDCNDFFAADIKQALQNALFPTAIVDVNQTETVHDVNYAGSEVLYFCLSQVPECRVTLGKIDKSLLTNAGNKGPTIDIWITIGATTTIQPFTRIIDPWGKPLRYDYYPDYADFVGTWLQYIDYRNKAKRTFPLITSAGPDKKFGTNDDISNIEQK